VSRGKIPRLLLPRHCFFTGPLPLVTGSNQLGIMLMARDRMMTMVKSEIVLSIIINILARRVMGKASVGLNAVAVLYPRYR
jgi:hypothetical protein